MRLIERNLLEIRPVNSELKHGKLSKERVSFFDSTMIMGKRTRDEHYLVKIINS